MNNTIIKPLIKPLIFVLISMSSALSVYASDLDALLEKVITDGYEESDTHKQREKAFLSNQKNQANLVEQTIQAIDDAKLLQIKLNNQLKLNESLITELETEIEEKAGDLSNVFSIVHQISEDQKVSLQQSVISSEFSNRMGTLSKIEDKNELPKIEDLKQLWLIIQHQMTQSAHVNTSSLLVTDIEGVESKETVIRFGGFNSVIKNEFLSYYAPNTKLLTLSKQPESKFINEINQWFSPEKSLVKNVVIDPTLGGVLQQYLLQPTIKDRIKQAGLVGYAIIFIGIIGLLVAAWRLVYLFGVNKKVQAQMNHLDDIRLDNPLGQLLSVAKDNNLENTALLESKLEESILSHVPQLDKGTNFIKLLAAVAPLLGLLGTVTGMIDTFQTIVDLGTSDPQSMADGISQALLTTVFGLLAAVPLLFCHSFVTSKVRALTVILSQQSAGLLAMHIKKTDTENNHD
ncbi:MotA/TolQ/ExbB proton channel family protein [Marinicellulosiphila megalodicopiae]|uniref:MotA/TolQ/ExbB proton channel family protein n=1 Tax=Marinicellulosiphila megalodicopiae TaxID=2724896 RepID=UPI003BAF5E2C